ncbi:MAG: hypothetical protein PVF54_10375, partial [Anaerolineae bacterium]
MRDRRTVDELSIEELEEFLLLRRREARLRRLRQHNNGEAEPLDPLASTKAGTPAPPSPPSEHRRFQDAGATSQYRARPVGQPTWNETADEAVGRSGLRVQWGWLREKSLLVVELGVLVALTLVLIGSLATLRQINRASSRSHIL